MTPLEAARKRQQLRTCLTCEDRVEIGGASYCRRDGKLLHPMLLEFPGRCPIEIRQAAQAGPMTCERLISADALIREILWCREQSAECSRSHWDDIIERINRQPTIERKAQGHWIRVPDEPGDEDNPAWDCSECDAMCAKKHNFCPCCGARMNIGEEGSEDNAGY